VDGLRYPELRHLRDDQRVELEKHEFMMGETRGRLAVTLDTLTDALILIGQHGVYCTSSRNPTVPALDIHAVLEQINGAKQLIQSAMGELERKCDQAPLLMPLFGIRVVP